MCCAGISLNWVPQGLVPRGLPAHGGIDERLDAARVRARRDEHRQHVHPRAHHRLRALRLARGLRPDVDAEHDGCRGAALLLWKPAADRAVEPRASCRGAAADHAEGRARGRTEALRQHLPGELQQGAGAEAGDCFDRDWRRGAGDRDVWRAQRGRNRLHPLLPRPFFSRRLYGRPIAWSHPWAALSTPSPMPRTSPASPPGCASILRGRVRLLQSALRA